jgi:gamma-glutamylcyclotransferase (GGCT)/AIG2-like uncharacterized protein YtfP
MVPELMGRVSGFRHPGEPALLHGYRRRRLRGELYPGIVRWPGDRVEGLLYRGLGTAQLEVLDAFEGATYRRVVVEVETDARRCMAQAYALRDDCRHLLGDREWSLQGFISDGLSRFVAAYPGMTPLMACDADDE